MENVLVFIQGKKLKREKIMAEELKLNDLVEIIYWPKLTKRNWIIVGFASNKTEAILRNIFTKEQAIQFLSKLKLQKKEED